MGEWCLHFTPRTESWGASSQTQLYSGVGMAEVLQVGVGSCVCPVGPSWPSLGQPWPISGAGVQAQLGL